MMLTVDMSEVDDAARNLEKLTGGAFAVPAVEELLQVWHDVARELAPIGETSELVNGIKIVFVEAVAAGAQGLIVSSAYYSGWVNFGTERQSPQPYFSAGMLAVGDVLAEVERRLGVMLEQLVKTGAMPTAA